jgi:rubrerythrin
MDRRFYKELWRVRFQKMLRLENESIENYKQLLDESNSKYPEHHVLKTSFQKLITDEEKHARLVKELLEILERQPD